MLSLQYEKLSLSSRKPLTAQALKPHPAELWESSLFSLQPVNALPTADLQTAARNSAVLRSNLTSVLALMDVKCSLLSVTLPETQICLTDLSGSRWGY